MSDVSRRTMAKGAAWSVPVLAAAATVPAMAASCLGQKKTVKKYTYAANAFNLSGAPGFLNVASFWVTVALHADTSGTDPCVTFVDNTNETVTMKVVNQRIEGSTAKSRVRSITLVQGNPNYTSTAKTVDPADRDHPLGSSDYEWTITFQPSRVYSMNDHRFYVTESTGDGGLVGGRIINNLIVDGAVGIAKF